MHLLSTTPAKANRDGDITLATYLLLSAGLALILGIVFLCIIPCYVGVPLLLMSGILARIAHVLP